MKIVSVEAVPVNLPFQEPVSDSWGKYESSNHGIVIVRSDSGEYGAGEIAFAWFGGAFRLCDEVNEMWAPRLIGMSIYDTAGIIALLDSFCPFSKRHLLAKAGVEMAVWDLIGKTLHVPVYQLIGGKQRDRLKLTGGFPMGSVDRMVEGAVQRVSEGYKELKLKVGLDDNRDLEAVRCIRAAIPDQIQLRVDANMAWKNAKRAKELIDEMVEEGVGIVEQPLPDTQLADLAWLRDNTRALILIDEGVWDVHDAKRNLDSRAADMLHVYISEAGGIAGSKSIFELAALHGTDCTIGSMPEGRIGAAASAHVAAAMPNLSNHASDIRGFTAYVQDVTNEDLIISEGYLQVPKGPGLGVTIDFDRLEKMRR
ncbi:mandelate racemase/muconate lactonizing enzyme family protein [Cohnella silvisoli]|uniref:Mandelate racemase/muconate lactonizing enzyme family protein n=1 Tax=Cohnella silvisoli TaxID=2873699 RepID=A0ABV1L3V3_9BACL|nr:mandelate racemase/muconate lactonizing enzyme family protein [Cohnella silvisoli]MCD9026242.1 mandelate racemase/muconate lactonizing enzyme family protein [Cohnella silvisoli]